MNNFQTEVLIFLSMYVKPQTKLHKQQEDQNKSDLSSLCKMLQQNREPRIKEINITPFYGSQTDALGFNEFLKQFQDLVGCK